MQMGDVERDAQAFGWDRGWNRITSEKYKKYGHLQRAYSRGWLFGRQDRERVDKHERNLAGIVDDNEQ
mgnify:FL=1